ncbi:MAG: hypothetical protein IPJ75_10350 [Ignavibacteriales bacterium]|nr:hypothetical protein [Ignavibacteriales bacterium]
MNEAYNLLVNEKEKFLGFYKFRFPVFHKSNVFYRDLVYCVKYYLSSRNVTLKDKILETQHKILLNTWKLQGY